MQLDQAADLVISIWNGKTSGPNMCHMNGIQSFSMQF